MTERQEVAEKLRENRIFHNAEEALQIICKCTIRTVRGSKGAMEALADLIDPICKYLPITCAVWFDDNDEEHEDIRLEAFTSSENAYCSVCGYEMMTGEEGWFDYERKEHGNRLIPRFNYCPNCGARVVIEDA